MAWRTRSQTPLWDGAVGPLSSQMPQPLGLLDRPSTNRLRVRLPAAASSKAGSRAGKWTLADGLVGVVANRVAMVGRRRLWHGRHRVGWWPAAADARRTDGSGGGGRSMAAGAGPASLRWSARTTEAGGPQPGCRWVRVCVFVVWLVWAAGSAFGGSPALRRTRRPAAEMSSWRLAGGPSGSVATTRTLAEGPVGIAAGGAV